MTTENTDFTHDALQALLADFRNSDVEFKAPKRVSVEQDRIRNLIATSNDYATMKASLETALEDYKERIARNDSMAGNEASTENFRETLDMIAATNLIERELLKPEPFHGETMLEIDVPSGKLVIADSLGPVFYPEAVGNINYGRAQHETTLKYAKDCKVASAFVGNSCPTITQQEDGTYVVVSLELNDEENDVIYVNGEKKVAHVITDSWSVELTDYRNWLAHGGEELTEGASHRYTVLNVTPGKYRWTVKSHADGWDYYEFPRAEFATLELIEGS